MRSSIERARAVHPRPCKIAPAEVEWRAECVVRDGSRETRACMRRWRVSCALVALAASARAQQEPQTPSEVPAPLVKPEPGAEAHDFGTGVQFFPVPNVANGKNEGTTLGLIGAFLYPDERGDIGSVFTVGVGVRDLVGINVFLDYRTNPTPNSFIEFYASKAEEVEQEYQVYFEDRKLDHGRYNMLYEFD